MSRLPPNVALSYRPLRCGVYVYNPRCGRPGSIGYVATDGAGVYIVSCFHVLARHPMSPASNGPAQSGEPIYQPDDSPPPSPVATLDVSRSDAAFDYACALVDPRVGAAAEALGLAPLGTPVPPTAAHVGERVIKSSVRTGVTEGVISAVRPDEIEIAPAANFPPGYRLSDGWDSGGLWTLARSGEPIGVHYAGNRMGFEAAYARPLTTILARTGLRPP